MLSKTVWGIALILLVTWAPPARASEDDALLPRAHGVGTPANDGGSRTLKVLYGSYTTLQVLDVTSTLEALNSGATEMNPVVRATGGEMAKFVLLKAGTGAAVIALNRSLAKKNKGAAIVTMVVLNIATAAVVAHNMRTARR